MERSPRRPWAVRRDLRDHAVSIENYRKGTAQSVGTSTLLSKGQAHLLQSILEPNFHHVVVVP